jgi:hypothetical protein
MVISPQISPPCSWNRTAKGGDPMKIKTKVKAGGVVLTGAD